MISERISAKEKMLYQGKDMIHGAIIDIAGCLLNMRKLFKIRDKMGRDKLKIVPMGIFENQPMIINEEIIAQGVVIGQPTQDSQTNGKNQISFHLKSDPEVS